MRLPSSASAAGGGSASARTAASVATTVMSAPTRPSEAAGRVSDTIVTPQPRRAGRQVRGNGYPRHERRPLERAHRDQEESADAAQEDRDGEEPDVRCGNHLGHDADVQVNPAAGEDHD